MMTTTILPDRLKRFLDPEIHLRKGSGSGVNGAFDACLVQAADYLSGGNGKTDAPKCVSVKIARYCIGLNDSLLFKEHRDLLKPYAEKIIGTAGESGEREVKRAYLLADYAIRVFAPIWLRADPKHRFDKQAAELEALRPIIDNDTRRAAMNAAASASFAESAASASFAANAANAANAARTAVLATYGDVLREKSLEALDAVIAVAA